MVFLNASGFCLSICLRCSKDVYKRQVSILPQLDVQQLFAEDPAIVTLELEEGKKTRPLSAQTSDAKVVEAVLMKDGAELERRILNVNTPAQFDIVQNGTYAVSYTHLDVYKRQPVYPIRMSWKKRSCTRYREVLLIY